MKFQFLGGAEEVGKLGLIVELDATKLLLDYGFTPGKPPKYPLEAPNVDLALLSHCHVDHSGMLPWLCSKYNTPVLSTSLTAWLTQVLALDSLKVARLEGYASPYQKPDIRKMMRNFSFVKYNDVLDLAGLEIKFHSSGHIPGSVMFELRGEKISLFTSDLNTINTQLVWGAHPVKCDYLFIEGTYAGREHVDRREIERKFLAKVEEVVNRGGKAIVPVFAVGRAQELMLVLENTRYDKWLDGMGKKINELFLDEPRYLRNPKGLQKVMTKTKVVRSDVTRRRAIKEADVIITTSGMLDGGPVLEYIKNLNQPRNAILLTGYQVKGSNGRRLLGERKLDFQGVLQKIDCEVEYFDFSAHCGHKELVSFVKGCEPEKVIIYHSDNREKLAEALSEYEVHLPKNGEFVELR
ncbi:MAG: MBL fold metallo-hydrolase [Candidatus Thermoplasmatota archaeon]|nr:MBL fold metallo-hydrolase [Candidatus Thermoplasmatota archaeon]